MKKSQKNLKKVAECLAMLGCVVALAYIAQAQKDKSAPARSDLTGHYEGTAKNNGGEVITVAFDLTEKEGAMSGMIHSDHGDFTITGGSHKGDAVTLEFDTGGATGTISLNATEDKLSGTWSAGDDGGPVEVKRVAAQEAPKEKS
jgi:hypothetical protein